MESHGFIAWTARSGAILGVGATREDAIANALMAGEFDGTLLTTPATGRLLNDETDAPWRIVAGVADIDTDEEAASLPYP